MMPLNALLGGYGGAMPWGSQPPQHLGFGGGGGMWGGQPPVSDPYGFGGGGAMPSWGSMPPQHLPFQTQMPTQPIGTPASPVPYPRSAMPMGNPAPFGGRMSLRSLM